MNLIESVKNFLCPPVCGFCGNFNINHLCVDCEKKANKLRNIKKEKSCLCFYKYKDQIRDILINYKFNQKSYLYNTLVKILTNQKNICEILKSYDIIIPVPIHKKRKLKRGYDQVYLIAKELGKYMDLEIDSNVLIKDVDNVPQSSLNKIERIQNVKGVYKVKNSQRIENKRIILFDDIYTTGSTVKECSEILEKSGAKEVLAVTIAKD